MIFALFHPLNNNLVYINLKIQLVSHEKHTAISSNNRLMLFREIIAVYFENHTEHISNRNTTMRIKR
jgi:hypothetical protein